MFGLWIWRVAITVLGWSTLIKGIGKIGFPEIIHVQAQRFKKKQWLSAFFIILLGAGSFVLEKFYNLIVW